MFICLKKPNFMSYPKSACHNTEDWELFKVWDATEFEDEEEDKVEHGFSAQGGVDEEGTRALMPPA